MEQENSPIKHEADNSPVKHGDENDHPVPWTPEDASRFLSNAIHEAQKPLADALKQRPITTPVLVLVVALMVAASIAIGWILSSQLSKSERAADQARTARDEAMVQQHQLQTKSDTLEARLTAAKEEQERLLQDYLKENDNLRVQAEGKRDNEEELRRLQFELVRYRRQNELLKTQISGLELEKQALSRQLDAVKAMAIGEDEEVIFDEGVPGPSGVTPAPASNLPPPSAPESETSKAEPPTEEAPIVVAPETATAPAGETKNAPSLGITSATDAAAVDTVAVETLESAETPTGTITVGGDGTNPPTLYESSRMYDEDPVVSVTARQSEAVRPAAPEAEAAEPPEEPAEAAQAEDDVVPAADTATTASEAEPEVEAEPEAKAEVPAEEVPATETPVEEQAPEQAPEAGEGEPAAGIGEAETVRNAEEQQPEATEPEADGEPEKPAAEEDASQRI